MNHKDPQSLGASESSTGDAAGSGAHPDSMSLGGENTLIGTPKRSIDQSMGDQATHAVSTGEFPDIENSAASDLGQRYLIEKPLGRGGMGEVLLALDTRLNRKVAIKRVPSDRANSPAAISRFLAGARSLAALNHPNILQVYDYGRDDSGPFFVMEYVAGGSLLDKYRNSGPMPLEQAVDLFCHLCDGLAQAHAAGIVHRDIKPSNILLTPEGTPKLSDFDLAKHETLPSSISSPGALLGTPEYMPPEQLSDANLTDCRSDLWSLAATFYQILTGNSPRALNLSAVPNRLRPFIRKSLETEPERRYQTAWEFKEALKQTTRAKPPRPPKLEVITEPGTCLACLHKNSLKRKFCSECSTSLTAYCFKCNTKLPVWEKVCPNCGKIQAKTLQAKRRHLQSEQARATMLRSKCCYDDAIAIAEKILDMEDHRFHELMVWAKDFVAETKLEWNEALVSAKDHFDQAEKHRAARDYSAAIRAIDAIPHAMRTITIRNCRDKMIAYEEESRELMVEIRQRLHERKLDGLLLKIERARELKGDLNELVSLEAELIERERKRREHSERIEQLLNASVRLLEQGDAKEAWRSVKSIAKSDLSQSQSIVWQRLQQTYLAEKRLIKLIAECTSDKRIEASELERMAIATVDYLLMNPNSKRINQFLDQVLSRLTSQSLANLPSSWLVKLPPDKRALLATKTPTGEKK
jgi:serine/threonine protein kinase